jgi:hypothetical protein
MTSIAWSMLGTLLLASSPAPERSATIVSIDGTSVSGLVSEVPGGFAVKTATGTVVVPFEKVREVNDAPAGRQATVVSIDGSSVTGALTEVPGGFNVQTASGAVVVPFEQVRHVNEATVEEPRPPEAPAATRQRFYFGASASGAYVPPINNASSSGTWAIGVDLTMMIALNRRFDVLVIVNYTHAETENTGTDAVLLAGGGEAWFGVYGLGVLTGLGYAKFNAKTATGWGDDSASVLLLGSPVRFRFGESVPQRLFLDVGAIVFLSHVPELFARVGYTILF